MKKKIKEYISVLIILCVSLSACGKLDKTTSIDYNSDTVVSETESGVITMPDVIGLPEIEAVELLENENMVVIVEYTTEYDKYFVEGTVAKASVNTNVRVERGTVITLYISKHENNLIGQGVFDNLILPDCPVEKKQIVLINISVNDVYLNLEFQNKSDNTISAFKYALGMFENDGKRIYNLEYEIHDINLMSGETITDKIELTNPNIAEITLENVQVIRTN